VMKVILGVAIGLLVGVACRFFEIPLPGPPAILGATLAVAIATGYTVTDKVLAARARVTTEPRRRAPRGRSSDRRRGHAPCATGIGTRLRCACNGPAFSAAGR
jgi:XapX domain-containing protein